MYWLFMVAAETPLIISVIIPTLNEAESIVATLQRLQPMRTKGHEVIIADGGSIDDTVKLSTPLVDQVIKSEKGRALQMNSGATHGSGNVLWFLHADTLIAPGHDELIIKYLSQDSRQWGMFNVRLSGDRFLFRIIERLINMRSCLTGIATGDQGIFIKRELFEDVGCFAQIPLMEDIDISKRLKKRSRPTCIKQTLVTSSRRWEKSGVISTIFLMWRLRLLYALGADPSQLARHYR